MKNIVICGDSFSRGIGCLDLENEPYGERIGKILNKPVINLAKGSSTHLSIFLQAKYAVDVITNAETDLVLVSNTSYDRVEWFPVDEVPMHAELSNFDVNYHQYPPYGEHSYQVRVDDYPMKDDPRYSGKMFTENLMGVIDYWETFASKNRESGYYGRFNNEPKERTKTLYDYAAMIHDPRINRIHSIGMLTMAHQLLKTAGINHLILTHELAAYSRYIPVENLVNISWSALSMKFPDTLPTMHTSPEGHKVASEIVLSKLQQNGWVK